MFPEFEKTAALASDHLVCDYINYKGIAQAFLWAPLSVQDSEMCNALLGSHKSLKDSRH